MVLPNSQDKYESLEFFFDFDGRFSKQTVALLKQDFVLSPLGIPFEWCEADVLSILETYPREPFCFCLLFASYTAELE